MPSLENAVGTALVPSLGQALAPVNQALHDKRIIDAQNQKQTLLQEALSTVFNPGNDEMGATGAIDLGTPELSRIAAIDPEVARVMLQIKKDNDLQSAAIVKKEAEEGLRVASLIKGKPYQEQVNLLNTVAQDKLAKGEDADEIIEMANMNEGRLGLEIDKLESMGLDLQSVSKSMLTETKDQVIKSSEITDGNVVIRKPDGTFETTKVMERAPTSGEGGKASAVTKIFDNGTTIQALPNGQVVVKSPDGSTVTGEDRVSVLNQARQEEISFQQTKAGATKAGTAAIDQSTKAFERIGTVKKSIANYDAAIEAIDNGAKTGFISSKLPSIRTASIELDNIQKALGLDVIGDTTFGALSKGELDLALSKALPKNLPPQALREWLVEKKDAQEKLSTYLEDVAIYLGTPGNTVKGWLEAQRSIAGSSSSEEPESNVIDFNELP